MMYQAGLRGVAALAVMASGVGTAAAGVVGPGLVESMGVLPGGNFSTAYNVSSDGSVVVGGGNATGGTQAIRWTRDGGAQAIPGSNNAVFAVSGDGRRAAGSGTLYTVGAPPISLGSGEIAAISYDGTRLVGATSTPGNLWIEGSGWTTLPGLGAGIDITPDAGWVLGNNGSNMTRWSQGTGTQLLGPGLANSISRDGRIVAGTQGLHALRWREGFGTQDLGTMPNAVALSVTGMSGDGAVIVGSASVQPPGQSTRPVPFIWTEATGLMSFRTFLNNQGIDVGGWSFYELHEISEDGRTIVGFGVNPDSQFTGLIVTVNSLPSPGAAVVFAGAGLVGLNRRRRRV
jgi:uncharacterized membrane protein